MQSALRTRDGLKISGPGGVRMKLTFTDSPVGTLKVWRMPLPGVSYTIGVDVATGKNRDAAKQQRLHRVIDGDDETRGSRDFSAAQVIDDDTGEQVCSFHANINTYDVALRIFALAIWYNTALLAVEVNNQGQGVQDILQRLGYTNFYVHLRNEKIEPNLGDAPEYGFKTTSITRPRMIARTHELLQHCASLRRNHQESLIHDDRLIKELSTFEFDDNGECRGMGRNKDDRVIAWMIANYVRTEKVSRRKEQPERDPLPYDDRHAWNVVKNMAKLMDGQPRRSQLDFTDDDLLR